MHRWPLRTFTAVVVMALFYATVPSVAQSVLTPSDEFDQIAEALDTVEQRLGEADAALAEARAKLDELQGVSPAVGPPSTGSASEPTTTAPTTVPTTTVPVTTVPTTTVTPGSVPGDPVATPDGIGSVGFAPLPLSPLTGSDPVGTGDRYVTSFTDLSGQAVSSLFDGADPRRQSAAVAFTNHVAGTAFTDPLVRPGQPQPALHEHTYLGNVLSADADLFDLVNEPTSWGAGSDAERRGRGFSGQRLNPNGPNDGYAAGIWWPSIFLNGEPVDYKAGIATYYVRRSWHQGERLHALPNGAGFVTFDVTLNETGQDWRLTVVGPSWFHPDIHLGPFPTADPHFNQQWLSWDRDKPGPEWLATPQLQIWIKFAKVDGVAYADVAELLTFGNPTGEGNIPPHVDYVSAVSSQVWWQEVIDRALNRNIDAADGRAGNLTFEGLRLR
jgi:hypothetical protein